MKIFDSWIQQKLDFDIFNEYRIYRIRYIKNLERNIAIGNLINNPYI